jgi:hypothetical protein
MKAQKAMRALAAFMLLVGISSTNAALCTASAFKVASLSTCDCPVGTGPAGGFTSALPYKAAAGYASPQGTSATTGQQLTAANTALLLCTDLLPGYQMAANTVLPTVCTNPASPGAYCTGFVTAFTGVSTTAAVPTGTTITSTGNDATGYTAVLANAADITTGANTGKSMARQNCPASSKNDGATAPFTPEKCMVVNGNKITAVTNGVASTIAPCAAGFTCPAGCTIKDSTAECAQTSCIGGGNTLGVAGGFICPASTYGTMGTTLAASIAALTGEIICGAGAGPDSNGDNCEVQDGYYGVDSVVGAGSPLTTPAMTACPTGITGTAAATLVLGCTTVAPGYNILADIPKLVTPGTPTALLAGITPCADNKYCPGGGTITFVGTAINAVTHIATAKSAGGALAVACLAGTGNTLTTTAQGINAVSISTGCVDLLPGYAFTPASSGDLAPTYIKKCADYAAAEYGCGGVANLFIDYTPETATIVAGTGLTWSTSTTTEFVLDATSPVTFTGTVTAGASGSGSAVRTTCPAGSTNTVDGSLISDCLLKPGYYVDESNLLTGATCPTGEYCPGGGPIGTAGGDLKCPLGSVGPTTSSLENSHIKDCTLSDGFYIATGALNTPVPCLAAAICAGGGPVGTAGGSVACPTGSLNAACAGGAASTTVNLTPASQPITVDVAAPTAAASPSVTITQTPSASSAASTVASMVVVTVAAMVAL